MDRSQKIRKLETETFDILVIGGGINGVGIARDAALRGLNVALIEKKDFGSGTSSTSAKLIHGGFRYLETYQFKIVLESIRERNILLKIAPHIVKRQQMLLPLFKTDRVNKWIVFLGMFVYDMFSRFKKPRHKRLKPHEITEICPFVKDDDLVGGVQYSDAITDDSRLCLVNAQDAEDKGGVILNYVEALDIDPTSSIRKIRVRDNLTNNEFNVIAKSVISVVGIWTSKLFEGDSNIPKVLPSLGSHVFFPRNTVKTGITYSYKSRKGGGYIVPWNNILLVGSTDNPYHGDIDNIVVPLEDTKFLFDELYRVVKDDDLLSKDNILGTFAGARPLFYEEGAITDISREFKIERISNGLTVVIGGKLTTYRLLAEKVLNKVCKHDLNIKSKCLTRKTLLLGSDVHDYSKFVKEMVMKLEKQNFAEDIIDHLLNTYGTKVNDILNIIDEDSDLKSRISPNKPVIKAEIPYILQYEFVETLSDIMIRRLNLIFYEDYGKDCLPFIVEYLRDHFEKNRKTGDIDTMIKKEKNQYHLETEKMKAGLGTSF